MTVSITDLDAMLHIVANVQWKAGNRDNKEIVKRHVKRFTATIEKNAGCTHSLRFFQTLNHTNYRKVILPEYKAHRKTSEAVAHWKPTIVEAFEELDAIALTHIESDDALNIVGRDIGLENITIITSDKDMKQMACKQYNPFNSYLGKVQDPRRWLDISAEYANKFLLQQVLSGDPTDMPNALCGIEGVGEGIASKAIAKGGKKAVRTMYSEKYGSKEGYKRANLTYKMVKLLDGTEKYLSPEVKIEIDVILKIYSSLLKEVPNVASELFSHQKPDVSKLFK